MIIDKLKSLSTLTDIEKNIATYILNEPWNILSMTLHDLSLATFSSDPSIMRFCKKLGYQGFTDFKYHFVAEYDEIINDKSNQLKGLSEQDISQREFFELYPKSISHIIQQISQNTNPSQINRIVKRMLSSQKILIFATNYSRHIAQIYGMKFSELGLDVSVLDSNDFYLFSYLHTKEVSTFAIIITVSGKNTLAQEIIPRMIQFNIPYLFISKNPHSEGALKATELIHINYDENDIMDRGFFTLALNYIFETIYLFAYLNDIKDMKQRIQKTYEFFPEFYQRQKTYK